MLLSSRSVRMAPRWRTREGIVLVRSLDGVDEGTRALSSDLQIMNDGALGRLYPLLSFFLAAVSVNVLQATPIKFRQVFRTKGIEDLH